VVAAVARAFDMLERTFCDGRAWTATECEP
jgi:hypothetical protein